jgi:hypothetical protein
MIVVVPAAGCGGSSGGGSGGGDRLTHAQYAAKADAICARYNQKTKALGSASNLSDLVKTFNRGLPLLTGVISELRALNPPKAEQHTVDRWLAQSEVLKHELQQMRDRAKAKDMKGVEDSFSRAGAAAKEGNRLAASLGLKVCSKG